MYKTQKFICNCCLIFFSSEEKLNEHKKKDCYKIVTELPTNSENFIEFNDINNCIELPFSIYADIECILPKINTCSQDQFKSSTMETNMHLPSAVGYYTVCSFNEH
jgi:hypothetical protein